MPQYQQNVISVLSVATQRSWKNTDDEWTEWHRVCVYEI
jgi:hypothetical protein